MIGMGDDDAHRLADLAGHSWVGFAPPLDRLAANRWLQARVAAPPVLVASTFAGLLAAAQAGLGVAILPAVSAPGLTAVLPHAELPTLPVWLVVHRDARELPHVAVFTDLLRRARVAHAVMAWNRGGDACCFASASDSEGLQPPSASAGSIRTRV